MKNTVFSLDNEPSYLLSPIVEAKIKHFLLSRTDNIGDVVLTLPMADVLRKHFPTATIGFLGKGYTRAVIRAAPAIDYFLDREDFLKGEAPNGLPEAFFSVFPEKEVVRQAKSMQIPQRIGTSHRVFHWFTCNQLVNLGRKNSALHEAQLNIQLLKGVGIKEVAYSLEHLKNLGRLKPQADLAPELALQLQKEARHKVILHPLSKNSALEWPLENYAELVRSLRDEPIVFYITGTKEDAEVLSSQRGTLLEEENVVNCCGRMDLGQLIAFIDACDGMVACSTGPLHLAAALNIKCLGLYPNLRPMHPGRWAPLGTEAQVLEGEAVDFKKGEKNYLSGIRVKEVSRYLKDWF